MRTIAFAFLAFAASSLHAQTTVAGLTPGAFRVTESGAAEYRIPIRVPPGIAGMEPRLAMVYNSQAGNGLLGVGWSLEGLSAVARCPSTMAQDGVRGGVNFDANDRYCLDGQRLIAKVGAATGVPAGCGSPNVEYHTERESFTRVISCGTAGSGPAWFHARTKAGQVIEYGNTANSRIEAQGKPSVRIWAASKVADVKGNELTLSYTEDEPNGQFRIATIAYGGTGSVAFSYETRPDITPTFQAGSLIKTTVRLTNIKTYIGTSLVSDYRLAYEPTTSIATKRSRLDTISHCDSANACYPPIDVAWQGELPTLFGTQMDWTSGADYGVDGVAQLGDFNGDGKSDIYVFRPGSGTHIVWLNDGTGGFDFSTAASNSGPGYGVDGVTRLGDFNADGKADIYLFRPASGTHYVWLNNGDGTFPFSTATWSSGPNYGVNAVPELADFDGDGRSDIYFFRPDSGTHHVWLNSGNGTFPLTTGTTWTSGPGYGVGGVTRLGDLDGDGKADIYLFRPAQGSHYVWLNSGDGTFTFSTVNWSAGPNVTTSAVPQLADFNGDGYPDIYLFRPVQGAHYVWLNKGNGTFPTTISFSSGNGYGVDGTASAGDFNGDGKADIYLFRPGSGTHYVWLNNGDVTFPFTAGATWTSGPDFGALGVTQLGNFNGDGKSDIYLFRPNSGTHHGWIVTGVFPDLVTSISNGLGATVAPSYKPLTDATVYVKDSGGDAAAYPDVDIQFPMYAVASVVLSNGVGGTSTSSYTYGGAKANYEGRGVLGYRWMEVSDLQTGIKSRTTFKQAWPYIGMVAAAETTHGSSSILRQVTNTVACVTPVTAAACAIAPGNRYFPYVSSSVETSFDLNGSTLPTVTTTSQYDGYGNATSVVIGTGDGYSKTTANVFNNDTANWFFGRLTRSTVQSTTP
jgi:hypothetical protein